MRKQSGRKRTSKVDSAVVDEADGVKVDEELVPGMRLWAICRGHRGTSDASWSSCGRFIASPSEDKTIRIWYANDGKCLSHAEGALGLGNMGRMVS